MKWGPRIALGGLVAFAAIQLVRPARTNPPEDAAEALHPPEPVREIFERSCNDCHSNHTRWPWYSNLAPVSWMVIHDVNDARGDLNFSEWAGYASDDRQRLLETICDEVKKGEMPLRRYLLIHRDARLNAEAVRTVCDWTKQSGSVLGAGR